MFKAPGYVIESGGKRINIAPMSAWKCERSIKMAEIMNMFSVELVEFVNDYDNLHWDVQFPRRDLPAADRDGADDAAALQDRG